MKHKPVEMPGSWEGDVLSSPPPPPAPFSELDVHTLASVLCARLPQRLPGLLFFPLRRLRLRWLGPVACRGGPHPSWAASSIPPRLSHWPRGGFPLCLFPLSRLPVGLAMGPRLPQTTGRLSGSAWEALVIPRVSPLPRNTGGRGGRAAGSLAGTEGSVGTRVGNLNLNNPTLTRGEAQTPWNVLSFWR